MVYFVGAQRLHTLSTLVYTIDAGDRSTTMPATHEQCHYYNPERIRFAFEGP